jgi:peptidyl-prolyl cis-trans isomerase SurA
VDIKNEFRYLSALNNNLKNLNKEKILNISINSIVNEKIKKIELLKYYKEIKINIEYSNMLLKRIYTRQGLKSLEEFEVYLEEYGLTIDDIREKITIDALWNQLVIKKYGAQIEINESKIYKNITQRNNNQTREYQLAEIIFEIKNKEEIKKKYKDIISNIKEVGFENAASMYSFAESSKIGGDIGWVSEASLNNKIKEIIINLKIGEISSPIILPNGVLILKVKNKRNAKIQINYKNELKKAIDFEKNRQLDQYAKIYFNKVKKNLEFNE